MSFSKLPYELCALVAKELTKESDINSLVQVDRRCFIWLNEYLYKHNAANRNTALVWGAKRGILATVTMALDAGADTEMKKACKSTPLILASKKPKIEILRLLLEHGANPNASGEYGFTALHFAVKSRKLAPVTLLLEHGASPNIRDRLHNTPLHLFRQKKVPMEILRLLLRFGADPSTQNSQRETPLHIAVERKDMDYLALLLKFHPDSAKFDMNSRSPLACAVRYQDEGFEMARLLLEHGANPNAAFPTRPRHAIHEVAQLGYARGLDLLLEFHADINARDYRGETALSLAIGNKHSMMARKLILAGAEVESSEDFSNPNSSQALLKRASENGDAMLCRLLLKNDPNPDIRLLFDKLSIADYDSPPATNALAYKGLCGKKMKRMLTQIPHATDSGAKIQC